MCCAMFFVSYLAYRPNWPGCSNYRGKERQIERKKGERERERNS